MESSKPCWNSSTISYWKKEAKKLQKTFADLFISGNNTTDPYTLFKPNEKKLLELKIGFALFNASDETEICDYDIKNYAYSKKQKRSIKLIFDAIVNVCEGQDIKFATIFLICCTKKVSFNCPLFRIKDNKNLVQFVDEQARVYKTWSDFVENNVLPECIFCYPEDGIYQKCNENVICDFTLSPNARDTRKVLSCIDVVSIGASLGSGAVVAASAFVAPPVILLAGVAGVASGAWSSYRAVKSLADRKKHKQSIGLENSQARSEWLNLGMGVIGGATSGVNGVGKVLAKSGQNITKVARIAMVTADVSSMSMTGLAVTCQIAEVIKNEKISLKDAMHISVAIFFFTSSVVNIKQLVNFPALQIPNSPAGMKSITSIFERGVQRPKYLTSLNEVQNIVVKIQHLCAYVTLLTKEIDKYLGKEKCLSLEKVHFTENTFPSEEENGLENTLNMLKTKLRSLFTLKEYHAIFGNNSMELHKINKLYLDALVNSLKSISDEDIDSLLKFAVRLLLEKKLYFDILIKAKYCIKNVHACEALVFYIITISRLFLVRGREHLKHSNTFFDILFYSKENDNYKNQNEKLIELLVDTINENITVATLCKLYKTENVFNNFCKDLSFYLHKCQPLLNVFETIICFQGNFENCIKMSLSLIPQNFKNSSVIDGNAVICGSLLWCLSLHSVFPDMSNDQIDALKDIIQLLCDIGAFS